MAERDVDVRLNFRQGGDALRSMEEIEERARRLVRSQRELTEETRRTNEERARTPRPYGETGGGGGGTYGLASSQGGASMAAAGYEELTRAVKEQTRFAREEKARAERAGKEGAAGGTSSLFKAGAAITGMNAAGQMLGNAVAPGKGLFEGIGAFGIQPIEMGKNLADAVKGDSEEMRRQERMFQHNSLTDQAEHKIRMAAGEAAARQVQFGARGRALAGVKTAGVTADRSTYEGQIAYENEQRRLPVTNARAVLEAEGRATAEEKAASDARLKKLIGQRGGLSGRLAGEEWSQNEAIKDTEDRWGRSTLGYGADDKRLRHEVGRDVQEASARLAQNEAEYAAEKARNEALAEKSLQNQSALRKNSIEMQKADLQNLQAKEGRMTSQQRTVGGMESWEYEHARDVARGAKGRKWADLNPHEKDVLRRLNPNWSGKQEEQAGEGRRKELANEGLAGFEKGDLGAVRQQNDKLQANIQANVVLDEQKLAEALVKLLGPALQELIKSIKVELKADLAKQKAGELMRWALGGG